MITSACLNSDKKGEREASHAAGLNFLDIKLALAIFLAAAAIFHQLAIAGVAGTFHDDAVYISTAKALAEGQGYHLINFPGSPEQTKYPILFPLVLSLIWRVQPAFPENTGSMQWLSSLSGALFLAITYLYLVRFAFINRWLAFAGCLFCCTLSSFAFFSAQVLSEMPFALSVVAAIWLLDSYLEKNGEGSFLEKAMLGAALAIPVLIRLVGIALPAVSFLLLCKRRKPFKTIAIVFAITILPLFVNTFAQVSNGIAETATNQVRTYHTDYLGWWMQNGVPYQMEIVYRNLTRLLENAGADFFMPGVMSYFDLSRNPDWDNTFRLLGGLILTGCFFKLRHLSLSWFILGYCLLICVWPWPPYRFLIPIVPYLIVAAFWWIERIAGALPSVNHKRIALLSTILPILLFNVNDLSNFCIYTQTSRVPSMEVPRYSISWGSYREAMDWIKQNSRKEDVIATTYDAMMFLYTGRKSIRPYSVDAAAAFYGKPGPVLGSIADFLDTLHQYRARYLALTPQPGYGEDKIFYELVEEVAATHEGLFNCVYQGADKRFRILEIDATVLKNNVQASADHKDSRLWSSSARGPDVLNVRRD